jgi:hypothetical protein
MAALGGCSISRSEVSRICALLDEEFAEFRERPLDEPYLYVWFDATYEKVRQGARIVSRAVAVGVRDTGEESVFGLAIGACETEAFWLEFLGVRGREVALHSVGQRGDRGRRRWCDISWEPAHHGSELVLLVLVARHVDHVPIWGADEEPPDAPGLCGERVDDLEASSPRLLICFLDAVTDGDGNRRILRGRSVASDELNDGPTVRGLKAGDPTHMESLDAEGEVVNVEVARLADVGDRQVREDIGDLHR